MGPVELLRERADDLCARRIGEPRQLLEMLVNGVLCRTALEGRADENGPFDGRREVDWLATDEMLPVLKNPHRHVAAE